MGLHPFGISHPVRALAGQGHGSRSAGPCPPPAQSPAIAGISPAHDAGRLSPARTIRPRAIETFPQDRVAHAAQGRVSEPATTKISLGTGADSRSRAGPECRLAVRSGDGYEGNDTFQQTPVVREGCF